MFFSAGYRIVVWKGVSFSLIRGERFFLFSFLSLQMLFTYIKLSTQLRLFFQVFSFLSKVFEGRPGGRVRVVVGESRGGTIFPILDARGVCAKTEMAAVLVFHLK